MFATAGSQAIVPVIAMVIWQPQVATREEIIGVLGVFILNGLFVLLFTRSALLFRNAAKQPERG
ncbi:MAG: hypothetical protein PF508_18650 [Spirochaeta sp.]|jgi:hypothetical protein|nr:hypothetical protein [Spirochaeta sp.]